MPLTDRQIRSFKTPEKTKKVSDGAGLHLLLTPNGSRLWRFSYRFAGSQKTLALGAYPHVTLAVARQKRDLAKGQIVVGIDPSQQQKVEKAEAKVAHGNTFSAIADELLKKETLEGRAKRTLDKKQWVLSLARPALERHPIKDVTAPEILAVLRKVEAQGNYETARRLRATVGQAFWFAIATALAENDPTSASRGAPSPPRTPTSTSKKVLRKQSFEVSQDEEL